MSETPASAPSVTFDARGMASTLPNPRVPVKLSKSLSTPAPEEERVSPAFKRQLTRAQSIRDQFTSGAANFFGIPPASNSGSSSGVSPNISSPIEIDKWTKRRMRHASKVYGKLKEGSVVGGQGPLTPDTPYVTGPRPLAKGVSTRGDFRSHTSVDYSVISWGRSISMSADTAHRGRLHRRDSVARMALDGLSNLVGKSRNKTTSTSRSGAASAKIDRIRRQSRSFTPGSIATDDNFFELPPPGAAGSQYDSVHSLGVGESDAMTMETIREGDPGEETAAEISRKPSVVGIEGIELQRLNLHEREDLNDNLRQLPTRPAHIRPPFKREKSVDFPTPLQDDVFFDLSPATLRQEQIGRDVADGNVLDGYFRSDPPSRPGLRRVQLPVSVSEIRRRVGPDPPPERRKMSDQPSRPNIPIGLMSYRKKSGGKTSGERKEETEPLNIRNIWSRIRTEALDNSDRRTFGQGIIGKCLGRRMKKPSEIPQDLRQQIDENFDHRPFFTYWVSVVQIVITIVSIILYGIGPIGFTREKRTATVLHATLSQEQVAYFKRQNFWIGPAYNDLVHMGAKYSPCMRHDKNVYDVIEGNRRIENSSACCIYNDKAGCFQATKNQCPSLIATHKKWSETNRSPDGRISGTVCGQDPRTCLNPKSYEVPWPDDLTKWPICVESTRSSTLEHMKCEITAHPCCIGIQGECRITTREYCNFVKGTFHQDAFLCSQVSCMEQICGMVSFLSKDYPNQFYRLFTSIFLHAGIVHVIVTCLIQWTLMRDLEKLLGWARISIIYFMSGIGGNLASAIFVPYQAEVGPSGCQFGLLAGLFVDVFYSWHLIVNPWRAVAKLSAITTSLFILGLLPWIDNWAHLFGFVFGFLLSFALFPYIQSKNGERSRRILVVFGSLVVFIAIFVLLVLLFYVTPIWDCKACGYFNCIPFTDHFCDNQGIKLDLLPI